MKLKIKFVVLFIALLLNGCKHKEKYEFIEKFLENPENLIEILKTYEFNSEYFREFYFTEKRLKFLIERAERFKIKDANGNTKIYFDVKGYNEEEMQNSENGKQIVYFIYIENKTKDFRLDFKWYKKDNDKWYLVEIRAKGKLPDDVYD